MAKTWVAIAFLLIVLIIALAALANHVPYRTKPFRRDLLSSGLSGLCSGKAINSEDFLKGSSLVTVQPIHSGDLKECLSDLINLNSPRCSGLKDEPMLVPVYAYLVRHAKHGDFLIDSGCNASYDKNVFGPMKGILFPYVQAETVLTPDQTIERQLAGVRDRIRGIFFTHLHFDHTSGLPALPKQLLYVAGRGEKSLSIPWLLQPHHFRNDDIVYLLNFDSPSAQQTPLGKAIDLFGDGTLWAVSTPGHSMGHVSYLVNTGDHPVLIAGDACLINRSMDLGVGPGKKSADIELAQRSFETILRFAQAHPKVRVWAGHDFPKEFEGN